MSGVADNESKLATTSQGKQSLPDGKYSSKKSLYLQALPKNITVVWMLKPKVVNKQTSISLSFVYIGATGKFRMGLLAILNRINEFYVTA